MGLLRSTKGDSSLLLTGDDLPVEATGVSFAWGVGEAISSEFVSASHPESRRPSVLGDECVDFEETEDTLCSVVVVVAGGSKVS